MRVLRSVWIYALAFTAVVGLGFRMAALAGSGGPQSPTTGAAYAIERAQLGTFPSPTDTDEDVTIADGHRVQPGNHMVFVVADAYEQTTRYLTWLTMELMDGGGAQNYTVPSKEIRVFYSCLGLSTQPEELYTEAVHGTVDIDEEKQLLIVDLTLELVSTTDPIERSQRHLTGKYLFTTTTFKELRWPWGSR